MQESDRYAQYETMGKHLPEEAPVTETLHPREEIVTLRAQHHAKIRHRVIGGLILVVTGAALGPLLFDEAPTMRSVDVKTTIPSVAKDSLNKIYIPVEASLSEQQTGQAPAGGLGLAKLDQQQDLTKVKPTDVSPQAAPQDVNVDKPAQVQDEGSYFIQVLATSSEAGAMKAMSRFQALGFPVHAVRIQKKSATLWRVRLGHFKTRAQAEEAVVYLDRRKIPHLTIQEEKGTQKPVAPKVVEEKSVPVAKPVVQKTEPPKVKPQVEPKPAVKAEVKKAAPVKPTATTSVEKKTVKAQAKSVQKPVAKPKPKAVEKAKPVKEKTATVKKSTKSDDPLAATLKAAQAEQKKSSGDFIAEQIAREQKRSKGKFL